MEESEIAEVVEKGGGGGLLVLPPPPSLTVAIAVKGNSKSKYIVLWALAKFVPQGKLMFKLFHVRPKITAVPTPMGNLIPLSQVREDIADAYRKEIEWQTTEKFIPHKRMCMLKKVQVEVLQIESDDVVYAISKEVSKSTINKLVIGVSSRGIFSRGRNLSSKISECAPSFCTVYAVSNGRLSSLRPSDVETRGSMKDDSSETSSSADNSTSHSSSSHADGSDSSSVASYAHFPPPSLPMQRFEALSTINQILNKKITSTIHSRIPSVDDGESEHAASSYFSNSEFWTPNSPASSFRSLVSDNKRWISDQPSTSDGLSNSSSQGQENFNLELEKLRTELRHVRGMYAIAQSETIDASRKINDLQKRRQEEAIKLNELKLKESLAKDAAINERVKYEAAKQEAEYVMACAEREGAKRREAEIIALREAKEKERLEKALVGPLQQYHMFEWEEIVSATSSLSDNLKIGMGAYGTVYKCSFHHTAAAVKVLHSPEAHKSKQFQQELDILSRIRHPHLLILLGACPDRGCLVYEYMENGSLEDRLFRKGNSPPIPWYKRFRIAWEIASALVFLHSSKPQPIIHRDLKPANVLLDSNFVSKIGDVGLSKMVDSKNSAMSTVCKDTGPVGTLCYIDPEYQRSGLISPKSDVYALGMVILQLVTAKSAMALTHVVETAVDDGHLAEILDPLAGEWPIEEAKELALLGLRCAELRRRDRPDLRDQVLPALERLKDFADGGRRVTSGPQPAPPSHFLCPILKDIMEDPCVASDGYTYDRKAILTWLEKNNLSPVTNVPLPNMTLIPNFTLLSAIIQWKTGKH